MTTRFPGARKVPYVFWILALTAIVAWSLVPGYVVGWDLNIYRAAIASMHAGHDPYADATAAQRAYYADLPAHAHDPIPYCYVYSPVTLPALRLIGMLPPLVSGTLFWLIYAAGIAAAIWFGFQWTEGRERRVFALLAPVVVFFPGLLEQDAFFSGNIAYILYGLAFAMAWVGLRRGQWGWFYAAVLAASCVKAPLLSLVAIPILSARRQVLPAVLTGVAGVALFALQPHIWPAAFHNYLDAVELQFSFNRDFSSSPAGLLANAFFHRIPYQVTSGVSYLLYGGAIFAAMWVLSRRFLAGALTLAQWMPVLLLGTILLNPRIMEYDAAPITLPMALVAWRLCARSGTFGRTIVWMAVFFAAINVAAVFDWRITEGLTLTGLFVGGARELFTQSKLVSEIEPVEAVA
ncbi:hypothetical protein SAMN05421770_103266 [Granulicella rosea]|uniref:DUF2029 domain-containing protein n=1 Tax=Granulicella rosea TaxID=474952 RepID=A0A239IT48_9BACT|nr:hypothetical protein [Granulicella rosea]SNS96749.1 hypothetical protein SAMN05421770_103266 [Granulicella rosea]